MAARDYRTIKITEHRVGKRLEVTVEENGVVLKFPTKKAAEEYMRQQRIKEREIYHQKMQAYQNRFRPGV